MSNQRSLIKKGTWPQFQAAVEEYLQLGHAEVIPPEVIEVPDHSCYYTCQCTGWSRKPPPLLNSGWRHQVGMSADISKMFREVVLGPSESDYHRFLLPQLSSFSFTDCKMKRLTFGVASSPFLATEVLRKAAEDYKHLFPYATDVVMNDFYVDDVLTGAPCV